MRYEWFEEVCSIRSDDIREQHERARRTAADDDGSLGLFSKFWAAVLDVYARQMPRSAAFVFKRERLRTTTCRVVDFVLDYFASFRCNYCN